MKKASESALRIDRWLWCVRFYKTRSAAAQAVKGGHVRLNAQRTKPAKELQIGDLLRISKGSVNFELIVAHIPNRRGPAGEAARCYQETEESLRRRETHDAQRRLVSSVIGSPTAGRPDKRTRRLMRARSRDRT